MPPSTTAVCPECLSWIHKAADGLDPVGGLVICSTCAAIVKFDKGGFRLLKTDEWWAVSRRPEYYDLCERRMNLLEVLTSPATEVSEDER